MPNVDVRCLDFKCGGTNVLFVCMLLTHSPHIVQFHHVCLWQLACDTVLRYRVFRVEVLAASCIFCRCWPADMLLNFESACGTLGAVVLLFCDRTRPSLRACCLRRRWIVITLNLQTCERPCMLGAGWSAQALSFATELESVVGGLSLDCILHSFSAQCSAQCSHSSVRLSSVRHSVCIAISRLMFFVVAILFT
jgi:hypothetical protein